MQFLFSVSNLISFWLNISEVKQKVDFCIYFEKYGNSITAFRYKILKGLVCRAGRQKGDSLKDIQILLHHGIPHCMLVFTNIFLHIYFEKFIIKLDNFKTFFLLKQYLYALILKHPNSQFVTFRHALQILFELFRIQSFLSGYFLSWNSKSFHADSSVYGKYVKDAAPFSSSTLICSFKCEYDHPFVNPQDGIYFLCYLLLLVSFNQNS